jgi:hypothetical protein
MAVAKRDLLHISQNKAPGLYSQNALKPACTSRLIAPEVSSAQDRNQGDAVMVRALFARVGSGQLSTTRDWGISIIQPASGR